MNLITMVPATAKFFEQMRAMRRYIVENGVTEFAVFQNWCDENNRRWAEALDSGCADSWIVKTDTNRGARFHIEAMREMGCASWEISIPII